MSCINFLYLTINVTQIFLLLCEIFLKKVSFFTTPFLYYSCLPYNNIENE